MRKSTKLMAGLGVVAGLGVALAPLATFADTTNLGVDHLTVVIESGCEMTSGQADNPDTTGTDESAYTPFENYYKVTMPAGSARTLGTAQRTDAGGTALSGATQTELHVQCNDAYPTGTSVSAATTGHGWSIKGAGTVLTGATTGDTIPNSDPSDGATSGWGVKLAKTDTNGDTAIASGYTDYKALPTTATVVAYGSTAGADAEVTIDSYKVSAAADQSADTYTGTATYTFVAPQA